MADERKLFTDVQVLGLKPGDILVVTAPPDLDRSTCERISREMLQMLKVCGYENRVVVLGSGMSLSVLQLPELKELCDLCEDVATTARDHEGAKLRFCKDHASQHDAGGRA